MRNPLDERPEKKLYWCIREGAATVAKKEENDEMTCWDILSQTDIAVNGISHVRHPKNMSLNMLTSDFDLWQFVSGSASVTGKDSVYSIRSGWNRHSIC